MPLMPLTLQDKFGTAYNIMVLYSTIESMDRVIVILIFFQSAVEVIARLFNYRHYYAVWQVHNQRELDITARGKPAADANESEIGNKWCGARNIRKLESAQEIVRYSWRRAISDHQLFELRKCAEAAQKLDIRHLYMKHHTAGRKSTSSDTQIRKAELNSTLHLSAFKALYLRALYLSAPLHTQKQGAFPERSSTNFISVGVESGDDGVNGEESGLEGKAARCRGIGERAGGTPRAAVTAMWVEGGIGAREIIGGVESDVESAMGRSGERRGLEEGATGKDVGVHGGGALLALKQRRNSAALYHLIRRCDDSKEMEELSCEVGRVMFGRVEAVVEGGGRIGREGGERNGWR
ncbi:hypothetical protein R3P38DRAFT_3440073 [Favolaschia claudopus]|uniref:Uncharacterized protein n=1 Tax=Favolaschia claudopus TaxID=2862362 RepID=A0AAW0CX16_9AGAR